MVCWLNKSILVLVQFFFLIPDSYSAKFNMKRFLNDTYFVGTTIVCKLKFNGYFGETLYYIYGYNFTHASVPLALSECPTILK